MTAPTRLTFVGHATVLIEIAGMRLLTDPILRERVGPLRRSGPPIDPAWYRGIDAVLISHLHWDHLDRGSLDLLGRTTRLIVPRGAARVMRPWGFRDVEELGAGAVTPVGPVAVQATPANHNGFRPPFGPTAACAGFVVRGRHSVYFAGDTDLFAEMESLVDRLDVALLPVWGWGPTLGPGHLDPRRAALALTLLRPRIAMPIHWGTLVPLALDWVRPETRFDPPRAFARFAATLAPDVDVRIVAAGGSLVLPE